MMHVQIKGKVRLGLSENGVDVGRYDIIRYRLSVGTLIPNDNYLSYILTEFKLKYRLLTTDSG